MPRTARIMVPGCPFHVSHRGNERRIVFGDDDDRLEYLRLLGRYSSQFGMAIWSYCLMPNHVHLIVVGPVKDAIPKAIGNTHRAYSRIRNQRRDVTGHQWANRFFSTALDVPHLWAAVRYVESNPVRAGMVRTATHYRWSSAGAHAGLNEDPLLAVDDPFPGPVADWGAWLALGLEEETEQRLRENTRSGKPSGHFPGIPEEPAQTG